MAKDNLYIPDFMDLIELKQVSKQLELLHEIQLITHRLRNRSKVENEPLKDSEANRIIELLALCAKLVECAPFIYDYIELAKQVAEAGKIYSQSPRAAGRAMGWSKGVRGPSRRVGEDCFVDPPEGFNQNTFFEYVTLVESGKSKKESLEYIVKKYQLQSPEAAIKKLETAKKDVINKLKKTGSDTKRFDGILPPNWPPTKSK